MLERIQEVLRNRKDGDKGFSLVELAVVIVIIGILVAIAVPIFMNIQKGANDAAGKAAAANGSAMVASTIAADSTKTPASVNGAAGLDKLKSGTITKIEATGADLTDYCVTVTYTGGNATTATKGPGC